MTIIPIMIDHDDDSQNEDYDQNDDEENIDFRKSLTATSQLQVIMVETNLNDEDFV